MVHPLFYIFIGQEKSWETSKYLHRRCILTLLFQSYINFASGKQYWFWNHSCTVGRSNKTYLVLANNIYWPGSQGLRQSLYSSPPNEDSVDHCSRQQIFQDLVKSFKKDCTVDDSPLGTDLPKNDSILQMMIPHKLDNIGPFEPETTTVLTDYLKQQFRGYSFLLLSSIYNIKGKDLIWNSTFLNL